MEVLVLCIGGCIFTNLLWRISKLQSLRRRLRRLNKSKKEKQSLILVVRSMYLWERKVLPRWVWDLKYSAITLWAKLLGKLGGLPVYHLGKSRLKIYMSLRSSWYTHAGGTACDSSEWSNPPQGPPISFRDRKDYRTLLNMRGVLC